MCVKTRKNGIINDRAREHLDVSSYVINLERLFGHGFDIFNQATNDISEKIYFCAG